jgi:glycosyltransferase involved in cell wall biosynthesis
VRPFCLLLDLLAHRAQEGSVAKVLWLGDAGCHTGFARVTHAIGERLIAEYGHDVHVLAYNHRGDHWPTSLKLYRPTLLEPRDIFGRSRHIEMLAKIEPDIVVMLNDSNILVQLLFENSRDPERVLLQYRPIITYIPVDGYNRPPGWASVLSNVTQVVAMSKFGQEAFPGSHLVYHGVDTETFYPVSPDRPITTSSGQTVSTKRECKAIFGYDRDGFLILRVDKNSGRKDWPATWKALNPVLRRHSDIQVHFHTNRADNDSGILFPPLLSREPDTKGQFFLPDELSMSSYQGWSNEDLCALYNAADMFVTTSRGEGFGLTIAESLACGIPVIAQNVSAIPEVVGPGGILIPGERLITVPSGQDLWLPDIEAFTEAIERLYLSAGMRRTLGEQGREHVVSSFSWDTAARKFDEYIAADMATAASTETSEESDAVSEQRGVAAVGA